MNIVKGLWLGSAAALLVAGGAQAADLPLKAKAVEYVKVCSLYGAGFYYIPGTDTCIKLGGYLRGDVVVNTNSDAGGNYAGAGAAKNRFTNAFTWRSREDLNIDTRTATEYGVVRTFFDATFSWTTDSYSGNGVVPGSSIYSAIGGSSAVAAGANANNGSSGTVAGGSVGVYYAFIQFAGFTMGKAISQFSAPWTNYPGNGFDSLVGGGGTVTGVNQFSYTADFGNGVSGTVSVQDPTAYYQAGVNNLGVANAGITAYGAFGASDYANTIAPDVVGMIRVDQAWGLFQASVAAHDNHAAYYGANEVTGSPSDKWGYAGQLALSIKNIPTGPGDTINVQGVYTNGATRYNIQDLSQAGAATIFGSSSAFYQSIGFGIAPDSVFVTGGDQQLIQSWGFRGAFVHNWNPNWATSLYGAWAAVRYNDTSKGYLCGAGGTFRSVFGAGIATCNPDYNFSQLGLLTSWTPVKGLTFSADAQWSHLDQNMTGFITYPGSAAIGKPAAAYELKDQDTWSVLLRAQRNW